MGYSARYCLRLKKIVSYLVSFIVIAICTVNIIISFWVVPVDNDVPTITDSAYNKNFLQRLKIWQSMKNNMNEYYYYQSIDIISIGSINRSEYQNAQQNTFITHPSVRNFYRYNEYNDTSDPYCYINLTQLQLNTIIQFCTTRNSDKQQQQQSRIVTLFSSNNDKLTFKPRNATGWVCAQKRPIDGLYHTIQSYINIHQQRNTRIMSPTPGSNLDGLIQDVIAVPSSSSSSSSSIGTSISIPKYLILMDDDTYLNMTFMRNILMKNYNYKRPYLLTGCLLQYNPSNIYKYPYGGHTTILTQKVIENLIRPIYCNSTNTMSVHKSNNNNNKRHYKRFNHHVCLRIHENLIGEQMYFVNGMSILDLMYNFSKSLPFTKIETKWMNGIGYCFHSDHALGYFFGYYYIGVPDHVWILHPLLSLQNTKKRGYSYNILSKEFNTCNNKRLDCGTPTTICHYNKPDHMYDMFQKENNSDSSVL